MKTSGSGFLHAIAVSLHGPTPERGQHGRITRDTETLADSDGAIGLPWRAETALERMERLGEIGSRERQAGEEFARLFHLAHLEPLKAADPARGTVRRAQPEPISGPDRARRRIAAALDALGGQGSPCGSCAWFVLGCGLTVNAWATREGWGGRPLRPAVAKGTLLGALGVLARHFGV